MIIISLDGVRVVAEYVPQGNKVIIVVEGVEGSDQIVKVMNLKEEANCKAYST